MVIPGQLFLAPKGASVVIFPVEHVLAPDLAYLNDKVKIYIYRRDFNNLLFFCRVSKMNEALLKCVKVQ